MGNKVVTYLLAVLVVITFSFGIIGFLNKDKKTSNESTPKNTTNEVVIEYTQIVKHVDDLETIVANYEFIKANKQNTSGDISASISGNIIKVEIPKSELSDATDDMDEVLKYEIVDVPTPNALQVHMTQTNDVRVYSLSSNGMIYMSTFNALPGSYNGVKTYKYNITDVESFTSTVGSLTSSTSQIYVIIKNSRGEYYSDYKYDETDEIVLIQLTSDPVMEESGEIVEQSGSSMSDIYKDKAIEYAKSNKLLDTNSETDIYIYKLIEEGILETNKLATDDVCMSSEHNTSVGCITVNGVSINDDYIKVSLKDGNYVAEYFNQ